MQTFLPYSDFYKSISILDNKRLGKQRVEAKQILNIIKNKKNRYEYKCNKCGAIYREKKSYCISVKLNDIINVELSKICGGKIKKLGYINHPIVKMWYNYENALKLYYNICLSVWMSRGFKNNMEYENINGHVDFPLWIHSLVFTDSHKSNLVRKDPKYYRQFFPDIRDDLPYVWIMRGQNENKNK